MVVLQHNIKELRKENKRLAEQAAKYKEDVRMIIILYYIRYAECKVFCVLQNEYM